MSNIASPRGTVAGFRHALPRLASILTLASTCLLAPAAAAEAAIPSGNLLVNGDAESGSCSHSPSTAATVPGWTTASGFTVLCYADNITLGPSVSTAIGGGANYFMGGVNSSSTAEQVVDVSAAATEIDAGGVQMTLSGYLGGYQNEQDTMIVVAVYESGTGQPLGSPVQLTPVLASDRGNQSTLIQRSTTTTVPTGTRKVDVKMDAARSSQPAVHTNNDAAADNMSLTLSSTGSACNPTAPDTPDLGFTDSNCDGIDGNAADAIFVSPKGSDSNPGTKTAPVASIETALGLAHNQSKTQILVAAGTYGKVTVESPYGGIGIYGGYDAATWQRSLSNVTMIKGSPEGADVWNLPSSAAATFQLVSIHGDPDNASGSAYGVRAHDGGSVILDHVSVSAARALDGGDGVTGAPGGKGEDGGPGAPGCLVQVVINDMWQCQTTGTLPQYLNPGDGGYGGAKITQAERTDYASVVDPVLGEPATDPGMAYFFDQIDDEAGDTDDFAAGQAPTGTLPDQVVDFDDDPTIDSYLQGSPGGDGASASGYDGGGPYVVDGEAGYDYEASDQMGGSAGATGAAAYIGGTPGNGQNGGPGRSGQPGAPGTGGSGSAGASWQSGDGQDGQDGTSGAGGGGGGAGGVYVPCQPNDYDCLWGTKGPVADGGGAGGAGGGYGQGGQGGQGGGGSFGVYSYNSSVTIEDGSTVSAGNGGNGGSAGDGGAGGAGGNGGAGSTYDSTPTVIGGFTLGKLATGGNGGPGGGGGGGGAGGAGAGGPSAAVYTVGTTVNVAADTTLTHGAAGSPGHSSGGAASSGVPGIAATCAGSCTTTSGGRTTSGPSAAGPPFTLAGIGVLRGTSISVTVFCGKPPCTGTLTLQTFKYSSIPTGISFAAAAGHTRLATGRFVIRRRGRVGLRIPLTAAGRRMLRRAGRLDAQAVATLRRGRRSQKVGGFLALDGRKPILPPAHVRPLSLTRGALVLPIQCGGASCHGTVQILLRRGSTTSILASAAMSLGRERGGRLTVALSHSALSLLREHGRATLTARFVIGSGRLAKVIFQKLSLGAAPLPVAARPRRASRPRSPSYPPFGPRHSGAVAA